MARRSPSVSWCSPRMRKAGRAGRSSSWCRPVPVVQAGKVRPLAVTSAARFPGLPDLPALNETLPGVVVDGWFGVVAPAGTPGEIVARVNREIGEFLKGPEIQQRLISFGLATGGAGTPESTRQLIREMQAHWQALARELDIQPQ